VTAQGTRLLTRPCGEQNSAANRQASRAEERKPMTSRTRLLLTSTEDDLRYKNKAG